MARRRQVAAPPGVREALIAKLSSHVRQQYDPRLVLVPEDQWPSPMPRYVDPTADLYDDLVAGKAVNVAALEVRRLVDFPREWTQVHIDVGGTVSAASYERVSRE